MTLRKVRLELARDPEFPTGSRDHGYEFVAPIGEEGHIDPVEWHQRREKCRVHRFWGGKDDEIGHLVRRGEGGWAFHYDVLGDEDDDEIGYRFGKHRFWVGDYVSIKEHDDVMRTFRVVSVTEAR